MAFPQPDPVDIARWRVGGPRELAIDKDEWRPGQLDTAVEIVSSQEPVVFVSGPPGFGKSVTAKAAESIWIEQQDEPVVTSTGTIFLQRQYEREFGTPVMVGRANFSCPVGYEDAAQAPCAYTENACPLQETNDCPFYAARNRAIAARRLVVNNDYLVNAWRGGSKVLYDRTLWLADEGHMLDEALRAAAGVDLSAQFLWSVSTKTGIAHPRDEADLDAWGAWAARVREAYAEPYRAFLRAARYGSKDAVKAQRPAARAYTTATSLRDLLAQPPVLFRPTPGGTRLEPVYARALFRRMRERQVFKSGTIGFDKVALLSATLPGPPVLARMLGLDDGQYRVIDLPSSFPVARRPLWVDPSVRVKKGMSDEALRDLVSRVDRYLSMWGTVKGIIHTHTYWLRDALLRYSAHKDRFITHSARGLPAAVEQFRGSVRGVLVSPAAHSGVDLPYDHVRFQLILKLPAADLGDPVVKARRADIPESYDLMTAATLTQAYGRGMRAPDDWCFTVLLDGNAVWWLKQAGHLLPAYVRDAVKIVRL